MDENVCSICNREISEHSQEEWLECLKIEDKVANVKIRRHYKQDEE
jgi:hypothetical protein